MTETTRSSTANADNRTDRPDYPTGYDLPGGGFLIRDSTTAWLQSLLAVEVPR